MKQTQCATLIGNTAHEVSVEATLTKGLPAFQIVGLGSSAIQESKERVKSALLSNGFNFPPLRITVNLSPSDIQKDGTQFDLAIALVIALQKDPVDLRQWGIFGELGLDGSVKSTGNLFAQLLEFTYKSSVGKLLVPQSMAKSLTALEGVEIYPVATLQDAIALLQGNLKILPLQTEDLPFRTLHIHGQKYYYESHFPDDFYDVRGQDIAKRAALIAAAGGHNLLMEGNPGCGKSMIAKRIRSILHPISHDELLQIAKLESLDGQHPTFSARRPMRSPHHSATHASIFGGGSQKARIGEIGLAHLGLLFFDELPHFSKQTLESLREPLEDRRLLISRVNTKIAYETDFLFIAAMNPCPCGNYLSQSRECRCTESEIQRYKNRLSDPFLDRIDLFVTMQESHPKDQPSVNSESMQQQVFQAFKQQKARQQSATNANLSPKELKTYCTLDESVEQLLHQAIQRYALSARSVDKVIKVSRTVADIEGSEKIGKQHLLEALSYRQRRTT